MRSLYRLSLSTLAVVALGACSSASAPPLGDSDAAPDGDAQDGSTPSDGRADAPDAHLDAREDAPDAPDAPRDAPGDVTCDFTPEGNDPACPVHYPDVANGTACTSPGLHCVYPGEGDVPGPDGCPEPAYINCVANDAGGAQWLKLQ